MKNYFSIAILIIFILSACAAPAPTATATLQAAEFIPTPTQTAPTQISPTQPMPTTEPIPPVVVDKVRAPLPVCPGTQPSRLYAGDFAVVRADLPLPVRIRENFGLQGKILGLALQESRLIVTGKPECADNYAWYPVRTEYGLEGWSAEGDGLKYWLDATGEQAEYVPSQTFQMAVEVGSSLYLIDLDSGQVDLLLNDISTGSIPPTWQWSPDGTKLLHFTSQADSQTLHIYDIEKKQETLALPNAQFSRPAWLPDSQALVYMQNDSTMVFISAEGQELDRVQFSNGEQIYGYSFSPDGAQMVVSAYQNNEYGIYIADLAVSSAGRLDAPDAAGLLSKRIYSILSTTEIHWSPMGEQIAFIAQENEKYEIFVINPDGTGLFNVTNSPQTVVTTLSWSPDGAKLAFTSDRMTPYQMDTYVIRVDGSELTRLSDSATGTAFTPSWTPDGARIMYSTFLDNNSAGSLFLVNPDGTQRQRIPTELLGVYALNGVFRP